MKYAEELFPKGTLPYQKTDGLYLDGTLSQNLDIFARKIVKDMHFLILITGNDSVGNGKSTFATQIGTYLTWRINQLHKVNNTFDSKNMFFHSVELMKKSPDLPKLSVVVLDEGDDLTTHGMKELAIRLKRYFRKCRQLNQIIILILPSFFELPRFYALARSHCLLNVKFADEFERGHFDFYGATKKKLLYMKGKRDWNYQAEKENFSGVFAPSYTFLCKNINEEIELYKKRKYEDMIDDNEEKEIDIDTIKTKVKKDMFLKLRKNMPQINMDQWSHGFRVTKKTLHLWQREIKANPLEIIGENTNTGTSFNNNPKDEELILEPPHA